MTALQQFNKQIAKIRKALESDKELNRSAYKRGVRSYAFELLEEYADQQQYNLASGKAVEALTNAALLNGAESWAQYSYGGCALVRDYDIAERLCTPSKFAQTNGGERQPNSWENWLDLQARALRSASWYIRIAARDCANC